MKGYFDTPENEDGLELKLTVREVRTIIQMAEFHKLKHMLNTDIFNLLEHIGREMKAQKKVDD